MDCGLVLRLDLSRGGEQAKHDLLIVLQEAKRLKVACPVQLEQELS